MLRNSTELTGIDSAEDREAVVSAQPLAISEKAEKGLRVGKFRAG